MAAETATRADELEQKAKPFLETDYYRELTRDLHEPIDEVDELVKALTELDEFLWNEATSHEEVRLSIDEKTAWLLHIFARNVRFHGEALVKAAGALDTLANRLYEPIPERVPADAR